MELIETITLGSSAASIEFTSIPQDGTDLVLVLSGRITQNASYWQMEMQFNGDTGSNYAWRSLYGDGSGSVASTNSTTTSIRVGYVQANSASSLANTFNSQQIVIPNYASSAAKSTSSESVTENNSTSTRAWLAAGSWTGTSAITSIKLESAGFDFMQYSTASLYKITKA